VAFCVAHLEIWAYETAGELLSMNKVALLGEVAGEMHCQPPKPPWLLVKIEGVADRKHVDFCTRVVCTGNFVTSRNCKVRINMQLQQFILRPTYIYMTYRYTKCFVQHVVFHHGASNPLNGLTEVYAF